MAASVLSAEDWVLKPEECENLAKASLAVADLYELEVDPRVTVWLNFGMVAGSIYGPRLLASAIKYKRSKSQVKASQNAFAQ